MGRLPVLETTAAVWRSQLAAMARLPGLFAVLLVIMVPNAYLQEQVIRIGEAEGFGLRTSLLGTAINLVYAVVSVPVLIGLHRHLILGETFGGYTASLTNNRGQRFLVSAIALMLFALVPQLIGAWTVPDPARPNLAPAILWLLLSLLLIFVGVRVMLIFPAVAVDAPGAGWWRAYRATRWRFWHLATILALTVGPLMLAQLGVRAILASQLGAPLVVIALVSSVFSLFSVGLIVGVASRVYLAYASLLLGQETQEQQMQEQGAPVARRAGAPDGGCALSPR